MYERLLKENESDPAELVISGKLHTSHEETS